MSEDGAAERRVGFIGWGPANRAIFLAIQASMHSSGATRAFGTGQDAWLFTHGPGGGVPEGMGQAPTVAALLAECGLVFLDAGPEDLEHLLPPMRLAVSDNNVIAVAGGHPSMGEIQSQLQERKLIQCLITAGAPPAEATFAYWATPEVETEERAAFRALFGQLEHVLELPDAAQFDVARGLAGVAPAIFYSLADAMADGALMMGVPRAEALPFLSSILLGSARRLRSSEEHPALLRERALEAETAAAALMEFESAGLRGTMMRVVEQAVRRVRPSKPFR